MNETVLFGGGGKKKKKRKSLNEEDAWYQSYFQPGKPHPYALDGSTSWTFYESAKKRKPKETLKEKENQMRQWLESQTTYALHRPAPKKYPRRPFVVNFMDEQWQADLSDMQWYKTENRGYAWMMVVIDVLSRFLWVEPLKNKTGEESTRGYKAIEQRALQNGHRLPSWLYVDKGTEFYNHIFQHHLASHTPPTYLISGHDGITKAAIAERVQLTLKKKLWKYFYETGSYNWVDTVQAIVDGYNARPHSSIKRAPMSVTPLIAASVRETLFAVRDSQRKDFQESNYKFQIGDVVRISKQKHMFRKGYLPQWTEEWFKIAARDPGPPPYYRLKEYKEEEGERIEGTFYEPELQLVTIEEQQRGLFRVEKILKRREEIKGRRKVKEVLVKFRGWPEKYNEWIPEGNVQHLNS